MFGYVQVRTEIDIKRIGAKQNDESVSGTTIVWTATRPTGGTVIIGWYTNATVYRKYQHHNANSSSSTQHKKENIDGYWIKANKNNACLLSVDARNFEIPRQEKGMMGQYSVWYADSEKATGLIKEVVKYINGYDNTAKPKPNQKRSRTQDTDRKIMVERAAIDACRIHYEALNYKVHSVEKENLGWDIEAICRKKKLRIEVKGLSGKEFAIEVTPNEYNALSKKDYDYRLVVVTNALECPQLFICHFSTEGRWIVKDNTGKDTGKKLDITLKTAASIKLSR